MFHEFAFFPLLQSPTAWGGQPSLAGPIPQQPPPIPTGGLAGGFGLDTEGGSGEVGSGYPGDGDVPPPYENSFLNQPFSPESNLNVNNHPFGVQAAPTTYAPLPTPSLSPIHLTPNSFDGNGVEDDEDFQQRVEVSLLQL